MKLLNSPIKFMVYAVSHAIRHPRTPITYCYCSSCKLRFNGIECPQCRSKVGHSPENTQESPIPWWGSIGVIILGITCWILGASIPVAGLDEAGRALVYIPLGNIFGMSLRR